MLSREENQNERVRKHLDGLHIDDFMGFCLDCFPDFHRRLSEGMTRTRCVNLLLEEVGAKDVLTELCRRYAKIREQVHNETEQTIWSALVGLDRMKQWEKLIGAMAARPQMNRLVVVHAQPSQHPELFVERMELHLRAATSCSLVKVPCKYLGKSARTGLGWEANLGAQLAESKKNAPGRAQVAELLQKESRQGPAVLMLLFADVPRQLFRDSHAPFCDGLREFLLDTLPMLLQGTSRITVVVPVEHAAPSSPLLDLFQSDSLAQVWNKPLHKRELLTLPELSFPSWEDVEMHLASSPDPIPNLEEVVTRLKPIYDNLQSESASYKELAESIEDAIAIAEIPVEKKP